MKKAIYYHFGENMFKHRGFSNARKYLKNNVSQKIKEYMNLYNITKSMATDSCTDPKVNYYNK